MEKIILGVLTSVLSSVAYADIIVPPKGKILQYDPNMLFLGICLFLLFTVNTGIVLYLKRNK